MDPVYHFVIEGKHHTRRLRLCVVNGISNRYLWHTNLELMVILRGDVTYFAGGRFHEMHTGDILFFNENCGHSVMINSTGTYALSLQLHPAVLQELGIFFRREPECLFVSREPFCTPRWLRQFRQMLSFTAGTLREGGGNKAAELSTALLFLQVFRGGGFLQPGSGRGAFPKSSAEIDLLRRYIAAHYEGPITLKGLAEQAGYSKNYLCELFRRQTGLPVMDYVNRIRLQAAVSLIEKTDASLTDIALRCGFADYGAFSAYMLRCCGRKPQEYKADILRDRDERHYRHYVPCSNPVVCSVLDSYESGVSREEGAAERDAALRSHAEAILSLLEL